MVCQFSNGRHFLKALSSTKLGCLSSKLINSKTRNLYLFILKF